MQSKYFKMKRWTAAACYTQWLFHYSFEYCECSRTF